jgi:hypothetical protein
MVGSAATVADHNIPGTHPITLIDMRAKSELPFAKEALDHMPVLRHVLTLGEEARGHGSIGFGMGWILRKRE